MTSLLADLRRVPTPLSVQSREPLVESVKRAQIEMFKIAAGSGQDASSRKLSAGLRRYALWLENAIYVAGNYEESSMEVAAALYEFAGQLTDIPPSTIFRPPLNDFVRSAIVASGTPFRGKASVVSSRIEDYLAGLSSSSPVEQSHILSARIIVGLLGRRFDRAFSLGRRLEQLAKIAAEEQARMDAPTHEIDALANTVAIGSAASKAASGMLTGIGRFVESSLLQLTDVRESADQLNDADRFWLSDRLYTTVETMYQASMHRQLGFVGSPIPARYRHILAQEGFLELWGPQLDALRLGLLVDGDRSNFVVAIPTGAGKTLMAELFILSALAGRDSWGVYVAPSRSLVSQVSQELRRRLEPCGVRIRTILAGAEQSFVMDEELELLPRARSIVVTTPEKLDTYYRNGKELFDNCGLVIFDEAHKVADASRGCLIETLITRFLTLQQDTRVALLSGVMTNPEEYSAWLGTERTKTVVERRRPTRQTYGVAVRQSPPVRLGEPKDKTDKVSQRPKTIRKIDFAGGLVIVNEQDDLSGDIEVDLPNLFKGHFSERHRAGRWVPDRNESKSPVTDHARELAESFASTPGTILVFFNDIRWVESAARKVRLADQAFVTERRQLAEFVGLELGDTHELCQLCSRGVAYHHARLPTSVQRAIELALERGWLKIVFATSTLREGLNTPATTVIVGGLSYRTKSGSTPISAMDFANIAGRAGRPRVDTEGRIILVPNVLSMASAAEAGRSYILSGEAARRVQSQIGALKIALEMAEGEIEDMPVDDQRNLLGLKAAGLTSADELSAFLDGTLWSLQESNEQEVPRLVSMVANAFAVAEERYGPRLALASRTSLSLSSSEHLRQSILEDLNLFERGAEAAHSNVRSRVRKLLSASFGIPEVSRHVDRSEAGTDVHLDPLLAWINGERYESVLQAGKESGLFRQSAKHSVAVKYCVDASNWISWSFGAAWAIIESEMEDPDPEVGLLPLFIKYGVPTATGAYLSLLGISDRNAALVLSMAFEETQQTASLQSISHWVQEVNVDEVFPHEQHHLRAELLRRQVFGSGFRTAPYQFASFTAFRRVSSGTEVSISRVGNDLLLSVGQDRVGQITKEDTPNILPLWTARSESGLYAETVSSAQEQQQALLVVIRSS